MVESASFKALKLACAMNTSNTVVLHTGKKCVWPDKSDKTTRNMTMVY